MVQTADRHAYLQSHVLVQTALESVGVRRGAGEWCIDPRGKPFIPGAPPFNLSHRKTHAALIVGLSAAAVGIDIEPWNGFDFTKDGPALAREHFTHQEQIELSRATSQSNLSHRFLQIWTRKEAALKAHGTGLRVSPSNIHVGLEGMSGVAIEDNGQSRHVMVTSLAHPEVACALACERLTT